MPGLSRHTGMSAPAWEQRLHGHGSAVQEPAPLCVPAPELEELLVPHNTQIKCQSTGRGMGHPWAALGSHRPWELQPGAHAGTNARVGKWPSPCAAPWGDKGSLCGSMAPWGLGQCCHGAGRGSSRAQGPAGRMGNTRDSAEKTSAGPPLRAPAQGRDQSGRTLPTERKQMPPAQPRHFPALSGGVEESAGSRGYILPWLCLPASYWIFQFRMGSKA